MRPLLFVSIAGVLVLVASAAFGQAIVDVKPYTPKPDGRSRADERIGERGDGSLPALPAPEDDQGSRPPSRSVPGRLGNGPRIGCGRPRVPESAPAPGRPPVSTATTGSIYLVRHLVNIRIVDGVSITEIDQTFHNSHARRMEGTYLCPLPAKAIVNRFSIFMGKNEVQGEVVEAGLGRRTYESIVRKAKDPGLVELVEGERPTIRVRIFPIPPRGAMRVKLSYAHVQDREAGRYVTRVSLKSITTKEHPTVEKLALNVKARSSWPMETVTAGAIRLRGSIAGSRMTWNASYKAKRFTPKGDLKIRCRSNRAKPGLALHLHRTPDGTRTFMAVVMAGGAILRSPTLTILGVKTENMYPCELESLPGGRQLLIFGRITGSGIPVARLTAQSGSSPIDLTAKRSRFTTSRATAFIADMWAQGRIEEIVGKRSYASLSPAEREEILALATRHGILTPLTAILAK
jgi:Vault protein inter-alpha-trypsin domain